MKSSPGLGEVTCPICSNQVLDENINKHLDSSCSEYSLTADNTADVSASTSTSTSTSARRRETPSNIKLAPIFSSGRPSQTHDSKQPSTPHGPSQSKLTEPHTTPQRSGGKRKADLAQPGQPSTKRLKGAAAKAQANAPLSEKLRPRNLSDFVGQRHLTGSDSLLMNLAENGSLGSLIFWGPPGCGKTTLSRLLARQGDAVFKELSATSSGINDVRVVFEEARSLLTLTGRRTILFLDEIHRFNKAQQDIFLPYIEQGQIQVIGATTENPSFKLTGALLSRCRVFVLERLTDDDVRGIISGAMSRVCSNDDESSHAPSSPIGDPSSSQLPSSQLSSSQLLPSQDPDAAVPYPSYPQLTSRVVASIVSLAFGDARTALSLLELVLSSRKDTKEDAILNSLRQSVSTSYDRTGDSHYDMISALHKSVRGSDANGAVYWLARMLTAGEDPVYIARRMVVCASEDIGLADNHALPLAMAALQACQNIGMPECRINLAHVVVYLAEAPKSTRSYQAYNRAEAAAKHDPTAPVPLQVRNAPTRLMEELGYSEGYMYNPDYLHPVHNDYLPASLRDEHFVRPAQDTTDKVWDEAALVRWEQERNGRRPWSGRDRADESTSNDSGPSRNSASPQKPPEP